MNARAMRKTFSLIAALSLALAACSSKEPLDNAPLAGAKIGGDFTLTGGDGKPVRWSDFKGKWRVVYFGYTKCPAVCPFDVANMMKGVKADPELAAEIRPIFITIDPERDTPARMAEYARAFPGLTALTGTPAQIAETAKAYAVFYSKQSPRPDGGYDMEHTRAAYLFDRGGKPIALLPTDKSAPEVAKELAKWVR